MLASKTQSITGNLLTPLSTFMGREREIGEAKQLLSANRLVTLNCAGGSGKTRLAIKVANELHGEFEHGVWLTEFAALSDVSLVLQAVALTLGRGQLPTSTIVRPEFSCEYGSWRVRASRLDLEEQSVWDV